MDFRPLGTVEAQKLREALRNNAEQDQPVFMGRDTSFVETADPTDDEVISAIKSVPCHY